MNHALRSLCVAVAAVIAVADKGEAQNHPGDTVGIRETVAAGTGAQSEPRRYGVSLTPGLAVAPLGEIAESHGIIAVPGAELEARLIALSANGSEWSVGLIGDHYRITQEGRPFANRRFEYSSIAAMVGRAGRELRGGVPVRYGIDLGVRYFSITSARPDVYEGEFIHSEVDGTAALLAVTYGVEVPSSGFIVAPRLRIEASFPDFGGGDGFSVLHRETDLGFRASFGFELRRLFGL